MIINNRNLENLLSLLKDNANTSFGKKYDFSSIDSFEEYQKRVPLAEYYMVQDDIEKMRQGMKDVLTSYELAGFCKTSGSTGIIKYIPITQKQLELFSDHLLRFSDEIFKELGGKRLMLSCFKINYDERIKQPVLLSEIHFQYIFKNGIRRLEDYVGGELAMFNPFIENNMYIKAWLLLSEEDITIIDSIYIYDVILLFRYIEENWAELLEDMENESIPRSRHLSKEESDLLLNHLPSQKRIIQIEESCSKGFNNIASLLWPRLRLINGISSMSSHVLENDLDFYLGDISKNYFGYCSSECMIGEANELNSYEYDLIWDTAIYEFRDINDLEKIVLPEELEIGKLYEPIITNYSGLYRYPMGDVIKCTGKSEDIVKVIFEGRRNHGINICGEKMSLALLKKSITMLHEKGIVLSDYCFGKSNDTVPSQYILWGRVKNNDLAVSSQQVAIYLDKFFKENNIDYKELRDENSIQKPICYLLDSKHYNDFKKKNGLNGGHSKPQHILGRSYEE